MFDTMFSRNPFSYFADDFEDLSPWTNSGYYRTPPRRQHRVRSAGPDEILRRTSGKRQPTWTTPFWETPDQEEEEMSMEIPVEKNHHHTARRKAGNKCQHKNHPTTRYNDLQQETDLSSGQTLNERKKEKENMPGEQKEIQLEKTASTTEATNEMQEKPATEDKSEECETVEQGCVGQKTDETEKTMKTEVKEETKEDEDQTPLLKEEDIKEKLDLINEQLKKARELAPEEVLASPRTDKQKLYLTEMLLRCILDLDCIETQGNETVKQRRREVVREIQSYLDIVENEN